MTYPRQLEGLNPRKNKSFSIDRKVYLCEAISFLALFNSPSAQTSMLVGFKSAGHLYFFDG